MKSQFLAAALAASLCAAASSAQAITVETTQFITDPLHSNGFEGIGSQTAFTGPYTEGGIKVEYVGALLLTGGIYTDLPGPEGSYNWYVPAGTGYTKITLADNSEFTDFQVLVGSGFNVDNLAPILNYDLFDKGVEVASGTEPVHLYQKGFQYYGFSGGTFDEARLKVLAAGFGNQEGGDYDAISIGSRSVVGPPPVPEPASWALMIGGFGLAGAALRRRRAAPAAVRI
jgi:hypothetical protein